MPASGISEGLGARVKWIDAAKGLGIALIVLGHVFSTREPSLFYQYLYAFHVPLFFFLAGLTLRVQAGQLALLIRKKLRSLMLPYAVYALLGYVFYLLGFGLTQILGRELEQFRYGLWAPLWGILWGNVGSGGLVNSPVWFLPALFWATLIVHEVNARFTSAPQRLGVIGAMTLLGVTMADSGVTLPMSLVPALLALPFLQAGWMHSQGLGRLPTQGAAFWMVLLLLLLLFAASPVNGFAMQSEANIGNPLLFYPFAFVGIALTTLLMQGADVWRQIWVWIGRHSLAVMVVHMLVIKSVQVVLAGLAGVSFVQLTGDLRWGLVVLLVTALALVPVVWVIDRWLPFTLGSVQPKAQHD